MRSHEIVGDLVRAETLASALVSELERGLIGQPPVMADPGTWFSDIRRDLLNSFRSVDVLRREYSSAKDAITSGLELVASRRERLLQGASATRNSSSMDALLGYDPRERVQLLDAELKSLGEQEKQLEAALAVLEAKPTNQTFLQGLYGSVEISLIGGSPGQWTAHGEVGARMTPVSDSGTRTYYPILMGGIDTLFGGVGYTLTTEKGSSGPMGNFTMIPGMTLGQTPRGRSAVVNVPGLFGFGIYERGEANLALAVPISPALNLATDIHFGNPAIKGFTTAALEKISSTTLTVNEWVFAARQWLGQPLRDQERG